jgi:Putative Flp pilus-assembly TadE/G-like
MISRFSKLTNHFKKRQRRERGQMILMLAGGMIVMVGMAALAVDLGLMTHTHREAQNDADAIALAVVRELPDESLADLISDAWAAKNDVELSEIQGGKPTYGTTCSGEDIDGTATVRIKRNQRTFFAGVFGIGNEDLNVCATAREGVAAAGTGIMPFGFHGEDPYPGVNPENVCYFNELDGSTNPTLWGNQCLLKIPKPNDSWGSGNSGAVRLDEGGEPGNYDESCSPGSSGASEYQENIEDGSECWYAIGDEIRPKPGAMKGPTCSAFSNRLSGNTETLEDVFGTPDSDGVYNHVNVNSPRYALVPIVTVSGSGSSADITIEGFITVYIDGACSGANCNGNGNNPACVVVTPVHSKIFLAGVDFAGGSVTLDDEINPLFTIKLVE